MKTTYTVDGHVCDACEERMAYATYKCLQCGCEHCYNCGQEAGARYAHGVHFSGSGDGYYCRTCDLYLLRSGNDRRHAAYVRIQLLRQEGKRFHDDFHARVDSAEAELKALS